MNRTIAINNNGSNLIIRIKTFFFYIIDNLCPIDLFQILLTLQILKK